MNKYFEEVSCGTIRACTTKTNPARINTKPAEPEGIEPAEVLGRIFRLLVNLILNVGAAISLLCALLGGAEIMKLLTTATRI